MYLTPAEYVIRTFGSIRKTAKAVGKTHQAVSNWKKPKSRNGLGGLIPSRAQQRILAAADALGLDITASDLIHGRDVK